jgi:hypothetical protein
VIAIHSASDTAACFVTAGVRAEQVDGTVRAFGRVDERCDIALAAHVHTHGRTAQLRCDGACAGLIEIGDCDVSSAFLREAARERTADASGAAGDGDDFARDVHLLFLPATVGLKPDLQLHAAAGVIPTAVDSLSILVFGATAARAATLGARVRSDHHADFFAAAGPGASILVMLVAARAAGRIARRQRQARRVRRQEALPGKSVCSGAGWFAWNNGYRVELGFRGTRLLRRLFFQSEQLAQRPSEGHRKSP